MLILECFQAGLSWECILNKRDAFREAFDDFDLDAVCAYGEDKLESLQNNLGIIRNRLKIQAAMRRSSVKYSRNTVALQSTFGIGPMAR